METVLSHTRESRISAKEQSGEALRLLHAQSSNLCKIREQRRGASDFLTEGFQLVLGGIGLGLLSTFAMVRLISAQLYGVSGRDP